VFEPAQPNSGLYQGDYAKRHVPFKADGSGSAYGPADFFVGAQIPVSGRLFTIVDADASTRALMLERYGVKLADPIEVPAAQFVPHVGGIVGHHPHPSKVVCDVGNEEDPLTGFYKKAPDTKGEHARARPRRGACALASERDAAVPTLTRCRPRALYTSLSLLLRAPRCRQVHGARLGHAAL
jgi:hypothetical protein